MAYRGWKVEVKQISEGNNNTVVPLRNASRRLSSSERRRIRAEGEYRFYLPYIEKGTRDHSLFCVSRYLWDSGLGEGKDQERADALWFWLSERRHFRSRSEEREARSACDRIALWRPTNLTKSDCYSEETIEKMVDNQMTPRMMETANKKRALDARIRIRIAVDEIVMLKYPVNVRTVCAAAHCSMTTALKHKDIWERLATRRNGDPNSTDQLDKRSVLKLSKEDLLYLSSICKKPGDAV